MALLDKINSLASQAGEKAGNAIESGKQMIKIKEEEKKINSYAEQIGKIVIDRIDNGQQMDDELMEIYAAVTASRQEIEAARAQQGEN